MRSCASARATVMALPGPRNLHIWTAYRHLNTYMVSGTLQVSALFSQLRTSVTTLSKDQREVQQAVFTFATRSGLRAA